MAPKSVGPAPSGPNDIIRLQELTNLKGSTVTVQNVTTGSEARPTGFQLVIWLGGASRPTNMANGDIWFATEAQATPVAPSITTTTLNTMTNGTPFTQTLIVTGTTPMTFAVTAGTLPSWASLGASTGTISGTPNATGAYDFTITATNSVGSSTPRRYQGTVGAAGTAPNITTTSLPTMTQNSAYDSGALVATGSTPITYGVTAGTIPAGLSINTSTGAISGTPTGTGAYNFTVTATNAYGSDTQQFTGTINAASAVEHSVFAATVPATLSTFNDAASGSWLANQFYITNSPARAWKIRGVKLYVPAGSGVIGQAWQIALKRRAAASGGIFTGSFSDFQQDIATNGSITNASGVLAAGWNSARFASPYDINSLDGVLVGVKIGDGTFYLHNGTLTENWIQATDGVNLYLHESVNGTDLRSSYRDSKSNARWYGIDIIVSET